eukprot:456036-Pleurochrysis_carterae.AAC.1
MLSGFSPALLKLLLTGGDIGSAEDEAGPTPGETVRRALNDSAFDPIRLALMDANRGIFAGYHFVTAATKLEDEEFEMVKWNTEAWLHEKCGIINSRSGVACSWRYTTHGVSFGVARNNVLGQSNSDGWHSGYPKPAALGP